MSNDDELEIFFKESKPSLITKQKPTVVEVKPVSARPPKAQPPASDAKKIPLISMKAFIFNFKKFYKEKTKIRNLLSEASSKQRNISLQIYYQNFIVLHLHNNIIKKAYPDVKNMLRETRKHEQVCLKQFEELAFKDVYQPPQISKYPIQETHIYVRDPQIDRLGMKTLNYKNLIANQCQKTLDQLFLSKESSFFEKRILLRYLKPFLTNEEYKPIDYEGLQKSFSAIQYLNSNNIQIIGSFIQQFYQIISRLEQNQQANNENKDFVFKLVDVAHFLYEQKYLRSDVEIITKFITKVKELFNKSLGHNKQESIDGDYPINLEFMTLAFNILSQKEKVEGELISEILLAIKNILKQYIQPTTVERVRKIMEYNLIADYLGKYLKDIDNQIARNLQNIDMISKLIMGGINALSLTNKQEQLEVLIGFMYRVQDFDIDSQMADILQKQGQTISALISMFEQQMEEATLSAFQKSKKQEELKPPQVKQILYLDDEDLKSGTVQNMKTTNPYDQQQADEPVRRPKIIEMDQISIHRNPHIQDFQKKLNEIADNGLTNQSGILAKSLRVPEHDSYFQQKQKIPIPKPTIKVSQNKSEKDDFFEEEFKKVAQELNNPGNKDAIISHLQDQISKLRLDIEVRKSGVQKTQKKQLK